MHDQSSLFAPDAPDPFDPAAIQTLRPVLSVLKISSRHQVEDEADAPTGPAIWACRPSPVPLDLLLLASHLQRGGRPWPRLVLDERWLKHEAVSARLGALGVIPPSHYQLRRRVMAGCSVITHLVDGGGLAQVAFKCDVPVIPVGWSVRRGPGGVPVGVTHRIGAPIRGRFGPKDTADQVVDRMDAMIREAVEALSAGS